LSGDAGEIAVENARILKKNGGENFAAIPCLNDSAPGMPVIWQIALRELKGWVWCDFPPRHARPCAGHPCLSISAQKQGPGTSPAMTRP
jgi:hypothetical protein